MKRLVLFVEGEGDEAAVPALVGRLLTQLPDDLQGQLFPDNAPMRVGGIESLTGRSADRLLTYVRRANGRKNLGAILVLLDGDADAVEGQPFCTVTAARMLAERSRGGGAGLAFSLGVVFMRQEFESLLIAVADQFDGLKAGLTLPPAVEEAPRDAKRWLDENLINGYKATTDQALLTRAVKDWTPARRLKSFCRLERALVELARAVATGQHFVSPRSPEPAAEKK
jgi:hypothetical protein